MSERWIILVEIHRSHAAALGMSQEQTVMLWGLFAALAVCVLIGVALSM